MDYDCILKVIGRKSAFFIVSIIVISVISYTTNVQRNALSMSLFQPSYQCQLSRAVLAKRDRNNISAYVSMNECQYKQSLNDVFKPCSNWRFTKNHMKMTFITEYKIVCQRKTIIILIYYLQLINIPLILLFGYLADQIGRKTCVIILLLFQTVVHLGIGFIDQLGLLVLLMALNKLTMFTEILSLIWLLELSETSYSEVVICIYVIPQIISTLSVSIISYLMRDWRVMYLISVLPTLLWFLILLIPESPRWLLVKNRHKAFLQSVKYIAKMNKIHVSNVFIDELLEETEWVGPSKSSIREFCKSPNLKYRLTMFSILGLSISVFPPQFTINILKLNPTDITLAYGYVAVISILFLLPIFLNLGVKNIGKTIKLTFTMILIMYIISLFLTKSRFAEYVICYVLTIFSLNLVRACRILLMVMGSYMMPTTHRSSALACILSCCLLGDIISTAFKEIKGNHRSRTNFSVFVLIACIFSTVLIICFHYLIPRVSRSIYPQTPAEAEAIDRGKEDTINLLQREKELSFKKKHNLPP